MLARERLGPTVLENGCRFVVWAPKADEVHVHILSPEDQYLPLRRDARGYFRGEFEGIAEGARYFYRLDGDREFPDPASRYQPEGVHGPSMVVASGFSWDDAHWRGIRLHDYIIYELHIGAFTKEGTLRSATACLDYLKDLGVNAVELMPVAQFPGGRNWGYDGVFPFAVQNSYGGPTALREFVNACHERQMAVILDVVYNHLGPEGNYLARFGNYFTDRYHTAWGQALNFDGPHSDEVRRFFTENALAWIADFHVDALRLDALHAILDFSSRTFIEDLSAAVGELRTQLDRRIYLIGESDANDRRLITPLQSGGYGIDAQWNEGFHHSLHTLLTGEDSGYYEDFGRVGHLAKAFKEGFVYSGEYSPYRARKHGSPSKDIPAERFVVFSQNHDQVGNRMLGERLSSLVTFELLKLAAGTVLLSPFVPLLFMGEEYGETAPFMYFTSHSDPVLAKAVREGRRAEFAAFRWSASVPDPQDPRTFEDSRLNVDLRKEDRHAVLFAFYRELLRLRRDVPALRNLSKDSQDVVSFERPRHLYVRRWYPDSDVLVAYSYADERSSLTIPAPEGALRKLFDSSDLRWKGAGSAVPDVIRSEGAIALDLMPRSFVVLAAEDSEIAARNNR